MSILSWLYGDAANAQAGAEADAKLKELNAAQYGADYKMIQDQQAGQDGIDPWVTPAEQDQQINDAFKSGLNDGAANISSTIKGSFDFVGKALGAVLLGIPFWVWLILAGGVWVYLGMPGLSKLKRNLE